MEEGVNARRREAVGHVNEGIATLSGRQVLGAAYLLGWVEDGRRSPHPIDR